MLFPDWVLTWSPSWRPGVVAVFAEGVCTANVTAGPQPVLPCFVFSFEV